MLCGNITSICVSGLVTIILSVVLAKMNGIASDDSTWDKTLDIDNPLSPWTELYEK